MARIEIPRLDVSAIVLEGVDKKTLRRGVGRIPETALPGDGGNVGLAAHRDSFFRGLKDIRKNDIVTLKTLDNTYYYRVEWTEIVLPKDTYVLEDSGVPELTLVTCYPFYYVGSAPKRFIVRANRVPRVGRGPGVRYSESHESAEAASRSSRSCWRGPRRGPVPRPHPPSAWSPPRLEPNW